MNEVVEFFRSIWGLWLMGLFLSAVFWAYRPRNKQMFEEAASIPLNDDLYDDVHKDPVVSSHHVTADKG